MTASCGLRVARAGIKKRLRSVVPESYLRTTCDTKPHVVRPFEEIAKSSEIYNKRTIDRGLSDGERPVPVVASVYPMEVTDIDLSRNYKWCSCGMSRYQPFCDQSHAGSAFKPLVFTVEQPVRAMYLCGCKLTSRPPFCDNETCKALRAKKEEPKA